MKEKMHKIFGGLSQTVFWKRYGFGVRGYLCLRLHTKFCWHHQLFSTRNNFHFLHCPSSRKFRWMYMVEWDLNLDIPSLTPEPLHHPGCSAFNLKEPLPVGIDNSLLSKPIMGSFLCFYLTLLCSRDKGRFCCVFHIEVSGSAILKNNMAEKQNPTFWNKISLTCE